MPPCCWNSHWSRRTSPLVLWVFGQCDSSGAMSEKPQRNQWDSSSELSASVCLKMGYTMVYPQFFSPVTGEADFHWISIKFWGTWAIQILEDGWIATDREVWAMSEFWFPRQTGLPITQGFCDFCYFFCHRGNGWFAPLGISLALSLKPIFTGLWVDEKHPGIKPSQMERFFMFSGYIIKFSCWVVSRISTRDFCGDSNTKTGDSTATMGHAASWCQLIHMSQPRTSVVWTLFKLPKFDIEPET